MNTYSLKKAKEVQPFKYTNMKNQSKQNTPSINGGELAVVITAVLFIVSITIIGCICG
jgi:hypothetical protein